jgi:glycosyltransferase 2 family protein
VLLLFGFALTRLQRSGAMVGPTVKTILGTGGYFVAVLCSLCLIVLVFLRFFSDTMLNRITAALSVLPERPRKVAEQVVTAFVRGMGSTKQGSFVAQLIAYTLVEWLIIVGCFYCLFQSFAATAHLGFTDILIFVGFVAFGSVIQIPGIGGGMQIASVLVLTEIFGLPLEEAGGIAILIWMVTFVVIVPFGLALAFHEGLNWKKLKQIEEEAGSL